MLAFLAWYLTITLIGWLAFPLVYSLFPALANRGYSLARAAGFLIWGYIFWLLASLRLAQNDLGGLVLGLSVLAGLNLFILRSQEKRAEMISWLRTNLRLLGSIELLFLLTFAFLAVVRAANPEITGTEKPMDLAFINAILSSPDFPPNDPWLSGYAISYYYFGHILTAMLARLTATPGSVAFNLMISLLFGLSAISAYGLIYDLLAATRRKVTQGSVLPLLGPLFLLLVSNLEGFLEILHRRGLFWKIDPDGSATSAFWTWLDMKELSLPPAQPYGWLPERFWWWWRASRVVQDYDLAGNWHEVIDEFPFFSYLLADLHPHVLAMPFALLAIAVALNIFLGGWQGEIKLPGMRLSITPGGFFFTAILLGGLAFLNTWDILVAAVLVCSAYLLFKVREDGWKWGRLEDFLFFGLAVGVSAILLYLPFYFGFSSQAGGILPSLVNPTRGVHLWVMFGSLILPILASLVYLGRAEKLSARWKIGFGLAVGVILFLWSLSWLLGWIVTVTRPGLAFAFIQSQGAADMRTLFVETLSKRMNSIGSLITLLFLLGLPLSLLIPSAIQPEDKPDNPANISPAPFILLMIALGALLVLGPEFLYLHDQFGTRMNTIFKFYYQAWLLWSMAAAFAAAVLLRDLRGIWDKLYRILFSILLVVALTYPVLGLLTKTNNFKPPFGWTLDGAAYIERGSPDEAAAIRWLRSAPLGVIAEAIGGSYTDYARISTHTGLPTVLGWIGHEGQWRGGYEEQGTRQQDIETLYITPHWEAAQVILQQYNIRYVYIGMLERTTYRVNETKFQRFLQPVFRQGDVVIYEVP